MGLFRLGIVAWASCDNLLDILEEDYCCQFLLGPKAGEHSSTGPDSKAETLSSWLNNSTDTTPLIYSAVNSFNVWSFWKSTVK